MDRREKEQALSEEYASSMEKEKQGFDQWLNSMKERYADWAVWCHRDSCEAEFVHYLFTTWQAAKQTKSEEIAALKAEIERKDEALRNIKIGAKRIQNLSYGFDSVKYAESIEDLTEQALSEEE